MLVAPVAFANGEAKGAAAPAGGGEGDMGKMMCSAFAGQKAEQMIKRGQTLQKLGKLHADGAKAMMKLKPAPAEARVMAQDAAKTIAAGKAMAAQGKWLKAASEKLAKKGDHSMADHMAAFGKLPAEWRKKHIDDGKALLGEMKEWAGEMAKMAEMWGGMMEKLEKAGDAK